MSIRRSCNRLKTDYLDIVLLHSDPEEKCLFESSEAVGALCRMRDLGAVRLVGASCYTIPGARAALQSGADVLMLTVNKNETGFFQLWPELEAQRTGILIKKPFNSGFLSLTPDAAGDAIRFVIEHTPAQLTSIIVGTLNVDHLKEHCRTAEQYNG